MKIETVEKKYGVLIEKHDNRFVAYRTGDMSVIGSDNKLYVLAGKLELWKRENDLMGY